VPDLRLRPHNPALRVELAVDAAEGREEELKAAVPVREDEQEENELEEADGGGVELYELLLPPGEVAEEARDAEEAEELDDLCTRECGGGEGGGGAYGSGRVRTGGMITGCAGWEGRE
jgi:hypothetical protein